VVVSVELIFETHSISVDNELGIATGWRDGVLSAEGRRLAVELGRRHREPPPGAVFTSDLGRAVETTEIAFGLTGIPIYLDERLRECDYGELTGMPVSQLKAERARRVDTPFPSGQSYQQVAKRVGTFLTTVVKAWDGDRVVLIGHAATHCALDHLLKGVPLDEVVVAPFEWQPGWRYILDSQNTRSFAF
jgi:broad specificity phosphatase PhoE